MNKVQDCNSLLGKQLPAAPHHIAAAAPPALWPQIERAACSGGAFLAMLETPSSPPPPDAVWPQIVSNGLLFVLVFCFAVSVRYSAARTKCYELLRAICVAMLLQFVMLPFLGYCVVHVLALHRVDGIMLLTITSSPGGAYSNWWCSLLNADLLLSVTATGVATILSVALLPLNLAIYLQLVYAVDEPSGLLRWNLLLTTVGVVSVGVVCGVAASLALARHEDAGSTSSPVYSRARGCSQPLGNIAGGLLILFSFVVVSERQPLWNREPMFYCAFGLPPLLAIGFSLLVASLPCLRLSRPSRTAVMVECGYQNIGIGFSVALTLFDGDDRGRAAGGPLFYGFMQMLLIPIALIVCWKAGWTYAPPSDPLLSVVRKSYQPAERPGPLSAHDAMTQPTVAVAAEDARPHSDRDVAVMECVPIYHHPVASATSSAETSSLPTPQQSPHREDEANSPNVMVEIPWPGSQDAIPSL